MWRAVKRACQRAAIMCVYGVFAFIVAWGVIAAMAQITQAPCGDGVVWMDRSNKGGDS